ncbi:efflux RND transporter permease subunit [Peredibacter starrii]|uniref:Efflux RND transporter permease subunit n=1 Tax=Peredibacter starrii TaxID=28202 RepID=A0AAX4HJ88_9BACT|nr:efflux RND transporter permease subunit [Peredibacter starrii]WPU63290.1 efflux RND transporter permease subunit [Peredibacter starrii]
MLNSIIKLALRQRLAVIAVSIILLIIGTWEALKLPVDVFPDLNRPVVTVMTEVKGLAPEETEVQVTMPIENVLNGLPGLVRIRSSSGAGISIVYAEFDWGTDIFKNRQIVSERLQLAREKLPEGIIPVMTPSSSIMGEIMFVGLTSPKEDVSPMELRTLAEWTIRPRLLAIPGVSQIITIGGDLKQYQILVSAEKIQAKGLTIEDLKHSLAEIGHNTSGGFIDIGEKEYLIRTIGRAETVKHIEEAFVGLHLGNPVKVKDIAEVKVGAYFKRGNGSVNGVPSVVMTIQKQPTAETTSLTRQIEKELENLKRSLPSGVEIKSDLFKQSHFIENAIGNVTEALRDGTIMVVIILMLFLLNWRTTFITLTAIPLSFVLTALIFKIFGISVNTMTLGGLAVAIGELVDDAIVDVENVHRRLNENKHLSNPRPVLKVIYEASKEIRNSIVFSTIIVVLVFIPLFALGGLEGKLFAPMGHAYIISILASLFVSLTLTPVLCYYLLGRNAESIKEEKDGLTVRTLKKWAAKLLDHTLNRPYLIMSGATVMFFIAVAAVPFMGRDFLPAFNEGSATLGLQATPGISLTESNRKGLEVEKALLTIPEVKSTTRRVGRAEMDEHAEGVNWNEIDIDFKKSERPREAIFNDIREKVKSVWPEVFVNLGQPISHRLDHMLSGVRSQIALKIFGPDIVELRRLGGEIFEKIKDIKGLEDLQVEPLVQIPQLKIFIDKEEVKRARMSAGSMAQDMEAMLNGYSVGNVIEGQQIHGIMLRLDEPSRSNPETIENIRLRLLPTGDHIQVKDVANVYKGSGPNMINREGLQRRLVVSANSHGVDLGELVSKIEKASKEIEWPEGYHMEVGGQFESQMKSSQQMIWLGLISLLLIFLILYFHFNSAVLSFQIMLNIPLALIGSVGAIYLTERSFSIASLIAFVTLCGIASRNGIMMISHYLHLMTEEGEKFGRAMIIRGTLERLVPVLMTALTAILALTPLLFAKGEAGKEILHPVAVVIVGGLLTSTLLDLFVTPAVFYLFGKNASQRYIDKNEQLKNEEF